MTQGSLPPALLEFMNNYRIAAADLMNLMAKTIEAGAPIAEILQQLNLAPQLLNQPQQLVDMEDAWRIMIASQNAVHEESHLMSSRPLRRGTTRLVFSSLQHCHTVEEGLNALADNYNIIHGGQFNFVRKQGKSISYCVDDSQFHYQAQPSPLAIEFALIKIHCALSFLSGRPLRLLRMQTKRETLPEHHHHLLLFDTQLQVGQPQYELAYCAEQAQLPLRQTTDIDIAGNIYAHYLSLLQQRQNNNFDDDYVQACLHKIRLHSAQHGLVNQELVAAELNTSVATLRRRLSQQGLNFRELLDKVNSELAVNGLHEGRSINEIANTLGYSDERSFKRAFKRWYRVSPAEYLKSHQQIGQP